MTTALLDLDKLNAVGIDEIDEWVWRDDLPTWLSLEETAVLLHEPLAEVTAMYELLAGKDD